MMYAHRDLRVTGVVILIPWVHSSATEASARLRTDYAGRLRSPDFWHRLARFEFDFRSSITSGWAYMGRAARGSTPGFSVLDFIERMRTGWAAFAGPSLLIVSGDDLTAAEFRHLCRKSPESQALIDEKVNRTVELAGANHTFARAERRDEVAEITLAWIRTLT
jgi:uncharacterized protein